MTYILLIKGRFPGLNDYIAAERANRYKGAQMKREAQTVALWAIREQLRGVHIKHPVRLWYTFHEPDRRRDHDNVAAFAHKVIQDALVVAEVLRDDGWDEVVGFSDAFILDRINPRIEVMIEEVV